MNEEENYAYPAAEGFVLPASNELVDPISDSECQSLANNTGLDPNDGMANCEALKDQLLILLSQILGDISDGNMVIFPNEDSKCYDTDKNPTLASMWSRIYRVSQAFTCILCEYDPSLSNMLMSGKYPQILMGNPTGEGYPIWQNPDTAPTEKSLRPVTSGGVFDAITQAITSVWHMWEGVENGTVDYFAETLDILNKQDLSGAKEGDIALVHQGGDGKNQFYTRKGSGWTAGRVNPDIESFAVIHVNKGYWADKGLYYFTDGKDITSWNLMDADPKDLEDRIAAIEKKYGNAIVTVDTSTVYALGVRSTLAEAQAVPSEPDRVKIILIAPEGQ